MKTFLIITAKTLALLAFGILAWATVSVLGSHEQSIIGLKKSISEQEMDRVMPSLKIVPKGAGPVEL